MVVGDRDVDDDGFGEHVTTATTKRFPRVVETLWESDDQFVALEILDDGNTRLRKGHPRGNRSYNPVTSTELTRLGDALNRKGNA